MQVAAFAKPKLDLKQVNRILRGGPEYWRRLVSDFELEFGRYVGVEHAIAVSSGTAALHLALSALDLKSRSVVTSPFSFSASANTIIHAGCKPKFADIELSAFGMDPERVNECISSDVCAIEVVHLYGQCGELDAILDIAKDNKLLIIEDASQALGAEFMGKRIGGFGHVACFSTHFSKNLSTIEGGIVVTNDSELSHRIRLLRDHGQDSPYHQVLLGFNYRLSPFHAAMGIEGIVDIDKINNIRMKHAREYTTRLAKLHSIRTPIELANRKHVFDEYPVMLSVDDEVERSQVVSSLNSSGIEVSVHYPTPIHLQPYYRSNFGYRPGMFPISERAARSVFSLPVQQELTDRDVQFVASKLVQQLSAPGPV